MSPFSISPRGRLRVVQEREQTAAGEGVPVDELIARFVFAGPDFVVEQPSNLHDALVRSASDEELIELFRQDDRLRSANGMRALLIDFLRKGDLEPADIQLVSGLPFCLPEANLAALRGFVLDVIDGKFVLIRDASLTM